jgi:hypothetical protein
VSDFLGAAISYLPAIRSTTVDIRAFNQFDHSLQVIHDIPPSFIPSKLLFVRFEFAAV